MWAVLLRIFPAALLLLLPQVDGAALRVAVAGAAGETGLLVFKKMQSKPKDFDVIGLTRTQPRKEALMAETAAADEKVFAADVTRESSSATLAAALAGCVALVICVGSKPVPTGEEDKETGLVRAVFPGGRPYSVDWLGQKRIIDAAKSAGVKHVVLSGMMGGTESFHPLNTLGRRQDGSGAGWILWKRKSEQYLMASGMDYTIVHAGSLGNEAGGFRKLSAGLDDKFFETDLQTVPREDLAECLVQSVLRDSYKNRSFDFAGEPEPQLDPVATDFGTLLDSLEGKNCTIEASSLPSAEEEAQEEANALSEV